MRILSFTMATILLIGATAAPASAQIDQPGKKEKAHKVCRMVKTTGTRMSKRYCRSVSDWEAEADRADRIIRQGQTDGYRRDGEFNPSGEGQRSEGVFAPR